MMSRVVCLRSRSLMLMRMEDLARWVDFHGVNNSQKALQRAKKAGKRKATARLNFLSLILNHRQLGDASWRARASTRDCISLLEGLGCRVTYHSSETRLAPDKFLLEVHLLVEMDKSTRYRDFRDVREAIRKRGIPRASAIKHWLEPKLRRS